MNSQEAEIYNKETNNGMKIEDTWKHYIHKNMEKN